MARQYYQPRAFPRVTMPTPSPMPDPLRTLSGLLSLKDHQREYDERTRQFEEADAVRAALSEHQGDLTGAAENLEAQEQWGNAGQLRHEAQEQAHVTRTQQQTELLNAHKLSQARLAEVTGFLQSIEMAPTDEAKDTLWAQGRDSYLAYLPEAFQDRVPAHRDDQFISSIIPLGLSAQEKVARRARIIEEANQVFTNATSQRERDEKGVPLLGEWLASIDPADPSAADQWKTTLSQVAETYQLSPGAIQHLGAFSPEQHARVLEQYGDPPEGAAGGSSDYGRALARHANSLGKSSDQLTTEDELAFRRQFTAAGRPSPVESKSPTGPSLAQIGAAERALFNALAGLQDRRDSFDYRTELTDEDVQQRRLNAFNTYRRSKGWPSWTRVPTPPKSGEEGWVPNPVLMRSPDGEEGWVSEAQASAAQAQGAVIVPMP